MTEQPKARVVYTHETVIIAGTMGDAERILMETINKVGKDNKCHVQTKALEGRIHEIKISIFMPENPDGQSTDGIPLVSSEEE